MGVVCAKRPVAVNEVIELRVMIYEDDWKRRLHMIYVVRQAQPGAEVQAFKNVTEAVAYAEKMQPEAAFISVEQSDGRGYFLIKKLRNLTPRTNVIAVAKECRFGAELMKLRISGYVTQRLTKEKVVEEMKNLRYREMETEQKAAL